MTNVVDPDIFFYDKQIKRYILQFMAVFSNLHVEFAKKDDREPAIVPVHLTYGAKDRVVAHIYGEHTQNKPLRLPTMAANLTNVDLALDRMKGQTSVRRAPYLERGGLLPNDVRVAEQRMPVPYNLSMELAIFTSNLDEHFQILEQILPLFDPFLQLQTSEDALDWTKIHKLELVGINSELNYPSGPDRRVLTTSLAFSCQGWIALPAKIKDNAIHTIQMRVGAVNSIVNGSDDILQQLDQAGYEYSEIFDYDRDVDLS